MPITIEKTRLNLWNVAGFAIVLMTSAFGWGVTYTAMRGADEQNARDISSIQTEIGTIKTHLPTISQLQYQVKTVTDLANENKSRVGETNARIDRVVESFGTRLDTIIDRLNVVATNVEVLTTRIDERPRRTSITN